MTCSMDEMLSMLQKYLIFDLMDHFETVRFRDEHNLIQVMKDIYSKTKRSFVILIDEWQSLWNLPANYWKPYGKGMQITEKAERRIIKKI